MATIDEVRQALKDHNRLKRSTDLPPFYGNATKDTISAMILVERFENAAELAGWATPRKKAQEFFPLLREDAYVWWTTVKNKPNFNPEDWPTIRKEFLEFFEPKYTAKTTCTNFVELQQGANENVKRYFLRVFEAARRLEEAKPENIETVRVVLAAPITNDNVNDAKKEGLKDMRMFFIHQLFLAGLRPELRGKVMEAGKPDVFEAFNAAKEIELINQDRKRINNIQVNALEEAAAAQPDPAEDLTEEELEAINLIRQRNGKPPLRGKPKGGRTKTSIKCRYCKKLGHMQKECRSRIRDGAPLVDGSGKAFKVQALEEEADHHGKAIQVGTIKDAADPYHLNWC